MEILFELIVQLVIEFIPALFEILIGIFGEVFLQVFGQGFFEIGAHGIAETFKKRKRRNPFLTAIGYLIWGAIIGGISLAIFRHSLIDQPAHRLMNLIVAPIVAGLAMAAIGAYRRKRGQELLRIDSFFYGFLFALGMAAVRYQFAH